MDFLFGVGEPMVGQVVVVVVIITIELHSTLML
jgi:hypothetical protein